MANENIGAIDCPLCEKSAHVRLTKKDKAYIVCDDCGFQGFARGFTANEKLRNKMRNVTKPAEVLPVVTVKTAVTLAPVLLVKVKPAVTLTEPPPVKELTIFDGAFWKGSDNDAG